MSLTLFAALAALGLFVGMLICLELGRRRGIARQTRDASGLAQGVGASEGAIFALLGLIIAFTFSGAATRFEERRHLITVEANAIGTAYLRLDLLPADAQPELRELFRRYTDLRASVYRQVEDTAATQHYLDEGAALQNIIWQKSLSAGRRPEAAAQAVILLLPALNDMIDITTTRTVSQQNHPPSIIFFMLAGLSLIASLLVGYSMSGNKERSWLHTLSFAATLALVTYVIVDLEYPRLGLIRVDTADQVLLDLKASMR